MQKHLSTYYPRGRNMDAAACDTHDLLDFNFPQKIEMSRIFFFPNLFVF